jgi:hypothetical protein
MLVHFLGVLWESVSSASDFFSTFFYRISLLRYFSYAVCNWCTCNGLFGFRDTKYHTYSGIGECNTYLPVWSKRPKLTFASILCLGPLCWSIDYTCRRLVAFFRGVRTHTHAPMWCVGRLLYAHTINFTIIYIWAHDRRWQLCDAWRIFFISILYPNFCYGDLFHLAVLCWGIDLLYYYTEGDRKNVLSVLRDSGVLLLCYFFVVWISYIPLYHTYLGGVVSEDVNFIITLLLSFLPSRGATISAWRAGDGDMLICDHIYAL